MKKTYKAPILRICVISESAMLCTSAPNIVNNGNATNNGKVLVINIINCKNF